MADRCLACGEPYEWCACAQWDGNEHDLDEHELDSDVSGSDRG